MSRASPKSLSSGSFSFLKSEVRTTSICPWKREGSWGDDKAWSYSSIEMSPKSNTHHIDATLPSRSLNSLLIFSCLYWTGASALHSSLNHQAASSLSCLWALAPLWDKSALAIFQDILSAPPSWSSLPDFPRWTSLLWLCNSTLWIASFIVLSITYTVYLPIWCIYLHCVLFQIYFFLFPTKHDVFEVKGCD